MLFKELVGIGAENISGRGSGRNDIAQAIHGAALEVDTSEQRRLHRGLTDA